MKVTFLLFFILTSCTSNLKKLDNEYDESINMGNHGTIKTSNNYAKLEKEIELSERFDFLKNENDEYYNKIKSNTDHLSKCDKNPKYYLETLENYEKTSETQKEYGYNENNKIVVRESKDVVLLVQKEEEKNTQLKNTYLKLKKEMKECDKLSYNKLEKRQSQLISQKLKRSGRMPAQVQEEGEQPPTTEQDVNPEQASVDSDNQPQIDQEPEQLEPPQEPYAIENNE